MRKGIKLSVLLMFLTIALLAQEVEVKKVGEYLVDAKALNTDRGINGRAFQQNAMMTINGYQYITWYDENRQVCLGRRLLPNGEWDIIRFTDYIFGKGDKHYRAHDSHNIISMGICPTDGTIHLAFDHHMHSLNYRVSEKGVATEPDKVEWSAKLFSPVRSGLYQGHSALVTYPRFIIAPDGSLQLFYRRGNRQSPEDRVMHTYNPLTGRWSKHRTIIGENAYTVYNSHYGDNGMLHLMFHWRGSGVLGYTYTDDFGKTWKNNAGLTVLEADNNKFIAKVDLDKVSVIKSKSSKFIQLGGQYMDSKSCPHIIVWHVPDTTVPRVIDNVRHVWRREQALHHHYWRDNDGEWHLNILPGSVGRRPKILLDKYDNAYAIYMVNSTDEYKYNLYFRKGDLVIASASADSRWTDWKVIHRESGPFFNEVLFDKERWQSDEILSIFVQITPELPYLYTPSLDDRTINRIVEPTPLKVMEYTFERK